MTSSLYIKDTPLRLKGKSYSKPFKIRWWYNEYDAKKDMHSLEHIFYVRRGIYGKWYQDTLYKTTLEVINNFVPLPIGGENDK